MPDGEYGRVIETVTFNRRTKLTYKFEKIYVFSLHKLEKFKLVIKLRVDMGIKELFHEFYPVRICHFYQMELQLILF
jgi:hypothetical protein